MYDRAHSSIAEADMKDFDFDEIFKNAAWSLLRNHPALSDSAALLTEEA